MLFRSRADEHEGFTNRRTGWYGQIFVIPIGSNERPLVSEGPFLFPAVLRPDTVLRLFLRGTVQIGQHGAVLRIDQ